MGKPILPQFPATKKNLWGEHFGSEFADLMAQLLIMLPEFRATASDALKAAWFAAVAGAQ